MKPMKFSSERPVYLPLPYVNVMRESTFRGLGYRDEMDRKFISFRDLYRVLAFGPPGDYVLEGA